MRESDLWKYVRAGLQTRCHLTRIESSAGNGVPDVSVGLPGKNAWIELKYIPEWPKRPGTKVKLPLRPEQKHWIKNRGHLSGDVWVICRIANTTFLLAWSVTEFLTTSGVPGSEWVNWSARHWDMGSICFTELYEALMEGC